MRLLRLIAILALVLSPALAFPLTLRTSIHHVRNHHPRDWPAGILLWPMVLLGISISVILQRYMS